MSYSHGGFGGDPQEETVVSQLVLVEKLNWLMFMLTLCIHSGQIFNPGHVLVVTCNPDATDPMHIAANPYYE